MKNKLLSALLATTLVVSMAACSSNSISPSNSPPGDTQISGTPIPEKQTPNTPADVVPTYEGFTEIVPPKYDWASLFSEGRAVVQLDGKFGYIDTNGDEVIPLQYDEAKVFSEGLAFVNLYGRWGVIDLDGNEVVPFTLEYSEVSYFSEGMAYVRLGNDEGFIDSSGNEIIPVGKYGFGHSSTQFSDGVVAADTATDDGFRSTSVLLDKQGNVIVPDGVWRTFQHTFVDSYDSKKNAPGGQAVKYSSDGLTVVYSRDGGGEGYVDTAGNVFITPQYSHASHFSNGFARVKKELGGQYAYIDSKGNELTGYIYSDNSRDFYEGMAAVQLFSYKWGFLSTDGVEVIPAMYDYVTDFSNGVALVQLNGKFGFIDKDGNEVSEFVDYEGQGYYINTGKYSVGDYREGLMVISFDDEEGNRKYGFINKDGMVVPPMYDEAQPFSEGLAVVNLDGKWGFIRIND